MVENLIAKCQKEKRSSGYLAENDTFLSQNFGILKTKIEMEK